MKDLIIIGGGPAGIAAGVYASRKYLNSVLIAEEIGGQSTVSEGIENWIGTVRISGEDLRKSFKEHIGAYKRDMLELVEGDVVEALEKTEEGFKARTRNGKEYSARAVLLASGAGRRKLSIPGADVFEHKGVTYCASCDGPLFAGQDVAVVGGGNAGIETAAQLLAYAKSVTIIHRHASFKADAITVKKVLEHENMRTMLNAEPVEVLGEKFVNGLVVRNKDTEELTTLPVTGVFVEIGVIPNTGYAKDVVELDAVNRVVTDPRTQRTSVPGIWAAGDCTDELYHQNNIAAGDAVKALEDIYLWLKAH
ncbi:FAD-dependent oxidoreductase [Patescibacteria group bacterium]|nr:FAD-dependent oxidoreductase [Patescibacteria group bacterium]MBU1500774.1 FAD-dependent oxidoreductase [Patescibacteria group bacterium]MBU2080829.1 FAD-dependent oxidoreductase [Patescibacteria group bacterium]MBU2123934.1 FAD-dependent oxidoreductase [Patescibacteria group bacterium]MBU2194775.1 FAD-dependent oxidoreductase [Patescibacteria group bacterium]